MKHTTFDCYGSKQHLLDDMKLINELLIDLTYELGLNPICPPHIIPYYYGKIKEDLGISAYVLLEGGHATIHTFPIRECYFVDVFSTSDYNEQDLYVFLQYKLPFKDSISSNCTKDRSIKSFDIQPYDSSCDFGPHLMAEISTTKDIDMDFLFNYLENLVEDINMDPISRAMVIKSTSIDPTYLSGIIVIAQSHIALHYEYETKNIYADIFSCSPFDYSVIEQHFHVLGNIVSNELVPRGTKHIYKVKNNIYEEEVLASSKWQKVIKKK